MKRRDDVHRVLLKGFRIVVWSSTKRPLLKIEHGIKSLQSQSADGAGVPKYDHYLQEEAVSRAARQSKKHVSK